MDSPARRAAAALLTVLAVVGATLLAWTLPAGAATEPDEVTWSVQTADNANGESRPNYQYELVPGQTLDDAIVVTNYSERELTFAVYAADGFLNEAAQLDLLPAGEESEHVGRWVSVAADEVTVGAGEAVSIDFRLTVPPDATPGDYAGGIVTSLGPSDSGEGVQVDRRLGSRVLLRVGGELRPALTISDVEVDHRGSWLPWQPGDATVTFTLENTGNVRLSGAQTVSFAGLLGLGGRSAATVEVEEMLPGSSFERTVELEGVWPMVRTTGTVAVDGAPVGGEDERPLAREAFALWTVPWSVLAGLAVVVAVVVLSRVRARRRRQGEDRHVAAAVAAAVAAL
ncbi:WxL protein peptidoglycan domain-containing protein [Georgenia sp. Marseille-Q6866]